MVGRENCFQFLYLLFRLLSLVTLPLLAPILPIIPPILPSSKRSCSCLGQATRYLRYRRFLVASLGFHARTFSPLPYGILAAISRLWTAEIEKHVAKTLSKLALTPFTPRFLKMTLADYQQHLRGGPQLMSHFVRDSSSPVNRKIGPYALIG